MTGKRRTRRFPIRASADSRRGRCFVDTDRITSFPRPFVGRDTRELFDVSADERLDIGFAPH